MLTTTMNNDSCQVMAMRAVMTSVPNRLLIRFESLARLLTSRMAENTSCNRSMSFDSSY